MRLAAVFALALFAAPAFAQEAPKLPELPDAALPESQQGENYKGNKGVYDLLLRVPDMPQGVLVGRRLSCTYEGEKKKMPDAKPEEVQKAVQECARQRRFIDSIAPPSKGKE